MERRRTCRRRAVAGVGVEVEIDKRTLREWVPEPGGIEKAMISYEATERSSVGASDLAVEKDGRETHLRSTTTRPRSSPSFLLQSFLHPLDPPKLESAREDNTQEV